MLGDPGDGGLFPGLTYVLPLQPPPLPVSSCSRSFSACRLPARPVAPRAVFVFLADSRTASNPIHARPSALLSTAEQNLLRHSRRSPFCLAHLAILSRPSRDPLSTIVLPLLPLVDRVWRDRDPRSMPTRLQLNSVEARRNHAGVIFTCSRSRFLFSRRCGFSGIFLPPGANL